MATTELAVHELDRRVMEQALAVHPGRRRMKQIDNRPDPDPSTGMYDIEKIYDMGLGEYRLNQPDQFELFNPRVEVLEETMVFADQIRAHGNYDTIKLRPVNRNGETVYEVFDGHRPFWAVRYLHQQYPEDHRWKRIRGTVFNMDAYAALEAKVRLELHKKTHSTRERISMVMQLIEFMQFKVRMAVEAVNPTGPDGAFTEADWVRAFEMWENEDDWVLDIASRARENFLNGRSHQMPEVTIDDVVSRVNYARQHIHRFLRLGNLPEEVQELIDHGLTMKGALYIARLPTKRLQISMALQAAEHGWKEQQLKDAVGKKMPRQHGPKQLPPPLALQKVLDAEKAAAAALRHLGKGKVAPEDAKAMLELRDKLLGLAAAIEAKVGTLEEVIEGVVVSE